jgi:hypothetical protein
MRISTAGSNLGCCTITSNVLLLFFGLMRGIPTRTGIRLAFYTVARTRTVTATTWLFFHNIVQEQFEFVSRHVIAVVGQQVPFAQFFLDFGQFETAVMRLFARIRR